MDEEKLQAWIKTLPQEQQAQYAALSGGNNVGGNMDKIATAINKPLPGTNDVGTDAVGTTDVSTSTIETDAPGAMSQVATMTDTVTGMVEMNVNKDEAIGTQKSEVQGGTAMLGDAGGVAADVYMKTGNPYLAAGAGLVSIVGQVGTNQSNIRLNEKVDAQTKFMNAKADEAYSVYTDPDSVYYRGSKGYYG